MFIYNLTDPKIEDLEIIRTHFVSRKLFAVQYIDCSSNMRIPILRLHLERTTYLNLDKENATSIKKGIIQIIFCPLSTRLLARKSQ